MSGLSSEVLLFLLTGNPEKEAEEQAQAFVDQYMHENPGLREYVTAIRRPG